MKKGLGGSVRESKEQVSTLRLVLSRRCSYPFSPTGTNGTEMHGTGTRRRYPVAHLFDDFSGRGVHRAKKRSRPLIA